MSDAGPRNDSERFEQAAIKVEKEQEFGKLKAAIEQAFLPEKAERFLKQLDRKGIRVRDFDAVLAQRVLEGFGEARLNATAVVSVAAGFGSGADARVLSVEDRRGRPALRHKFNKLYQYY